MTTTSCNIIVNDASVTAADVDTNDGLNQVLRRCSVCLVAQGALQTLPSCRGASKHLLLRGARRLVLVSSRDGVIVRSVEEDESPGSAPAGIVSSTVGRLTTVTEEQVLEGTGDGVVPPGREESGDGHESPGRAPVGTVSSTVQRPLAVTDETVLEGTADENESSGRAPVGIAPTTDGRPLVVTRNAVRQFLSLRSGGSIGQLQPIVQVITLERLGEEG